MSFKYEWCYSLRWPWPNIFWQLSAFVNFNVLFSLSYPLAGSYSSHLLARVLFDFHALSSREISAKKGDIVIIHRPVNHHWVEVEDSQSGLKVSLIFIKSNSSFHHWINQHKGVSINQPENISNHWDNHDSYPHQSKMLSGLKRYFTLTLFNKSIFHGTTNWINVCFFLVHFYQVIDTLRFSYLPVILRLILFNNLISLLSHYRVLCLEVIWIMNKKELPKLNLILTLKLQLKFPLKK